MLRCPRSPGRLRFRARVAHGFCTTATCAYPLGDDDHHNDDPGHDTRRGCRKPRQCDNCDYSDYNARRKNHYCDRSTASAPVGSRAGSAVSRLCMDRRLLDVAQQRISMDIGTLGIAAEPGFRVGRTALGTTRQRLQVYRRLLELNRPRRLLAHSENCSKLGPSPEANTTFDRFECGRLREF